MGTSSAVISIQIVHPRPGAGRHEDARPCARGTARDGRCHARVRHAWVDTGMSTGSGRSHARNTMPVSAAPGAGSTPPLTAVQAHAHRTGEGLEGTLRSIRDFSATLGRSTVGLYPLIENKVTPAPDGAAQPATAAQGRPPRWRCSALRSSEKKGRQSRSGVVPEDQSACLRRKAGISRSSMPLSRTAHRPAPQPAVRLVRHTLGTACTSRLASAPPGCGGRHARRCPRPCRCPPWDRPCCRCRCANPPLHHRNGLAPRIGARQAVAMTVTRGRHPGCRRRRHHK